MISRTTPTNILPQGSRLWTAPIQDKLCHLLFNQPYQETALCIDLFPMGLRGNPKVVDFFVMQEETRRAVSSTTLRLLR